MVRFALSLYAQLGALIVGSFSGNGACLSEEAVPIAFTSRIPLGLIEPNLSNPPATARVIALGEALFFDPSLSSTRSMSCATCHDPRHGFAESRGVSVAATGKSMRRNAPPVFNSGFGGLLGWDGRFSTLESQIDGVFSIYGDMGIDMAESVRRISADEDYRDKFREAFGTPPNSSAVRTAIAAYQRSLLSGSTRFDRFLYADQIDALTRVEQEGFDLFIGRASCITCHDVFHPSTNNLGGAIALFTDHRFHNLGVGYSNGQMNDTGRYEVTRDKSDWGTFKTPTLRNVALTAPYMHDGSLATLEDVVSFYNRGGNPNPNLSPGIKALFLTIGEKLALVEFLRSLSDDRLANGKRLRSYLTTEPNFGTTDEAQVSDRVKARLLVEGE